MPKVIRFEEVSKYYRLNAGQESLREALSNIPKKLLNREQKKLASKGHWALKKVSFDVEEGTVLGFIGSNGAGKTTILKTLCGVTKPTEGRIDIRGRISALIELGAGFHPDLTGRENIYLNGVILGLSQAEVQKKFDSIVEFAELEKFIDTPVKRYSSGMYARLGFSVASHVNPDILLIDEVLAVGDVNFQQKCFEFIHKFVTSGKTTVFVSHNLYALEQLCDQILWLENGTKICMGPAHEVLANYMNEQDKRIIQLGKITHEEGSPISIERVYLTDLDDQIKQEFQSGEDIRVHIIFSSSAPLPRPHFAVSVWDVATRQSIFIASMLVDNQAPELVDGPGHLICQFKSPALMPRAYQVWGEVFGGDRKSMLIPWQPYCGFTIKDDSLNVVLAGSLRHRRADAPVKVPYTWIYNNHS